MHRWRLVAALAWALVLTASCTGADDGDDSADGGPAGPLPDLSGDTVPIPAEQVGDLTLTRIDEGRDAWGQVREWVDVVVTDVDGEVVLVSVAPIAREGGDPLLTFDGLGDPGPTLADGRPTRRAYYYDHYDIDETLAVELPDGMALYASTRDGSVETLARVLEATSVPLDDPGAVPGDVIGVLRADDPSRTGVTYERDDGTPLSFQLEEATPEQQRAYRALVHPEPASTIDPLTEASCCERAILEPLREVTMGQRVGWIATLTPYQRILVVDGDPGLVLHLGASGQLRVEDDLIAVAAVIGAGSPAERTALAERLRAEAIEARAAEAQAYEESIGWEVVERVDFDDAAVLLTTGTVRRPERPGDDPTASLCAVIEPDSTPSCLLTGTGPDLALAPDRAGVIFGVAPSGAETVAMERQDERVPARVVPLDLGPEVPSQVFVLHTGQEPYDVFGRTFDDRHEITVVARDANGAEMARVPLYPGGG